MRIAFVILGITLAAINVLLLKKTYERKFKLFAVLEIVLNIIFVVVGLIKNNSAINDLFDLFSINMLMYLAVCDIVEGQLPVVAFSIYALVGVVAGLFGEFVITIIFTLVIFLALLLASKKSKEGIGKGDVYAIACVSLFNSTANTMSIVIISLLLSLIYGIADSIIHKTGFKTTVAYIPFLMIAYYLIKITY